MMNQYNNPDYCFCNQPGGDCEDMTFEEWEAYNECMENYNDNASCICFIFGTDTPESCDELIESLIDSFNIDDDQQYNELTEAEKELVRQYPFRAKMIGENKIIAEQKTLEKMGVNYINDCSDAFRHAYFNAINARDVGPDIAELFGNAHESEVPDHLLLEKTMDLHNNGKGITLFKYNTNASDEELADILADQIYNLEYIFLHPITLESTDPCFWGGPNCSYPTHGINSNTSITIVSTYNCN